VLVLDLSLPNRGGADILQDVVGLHPDVRTVILSMYPEDQLSLHLLRLGASAYLNKQRAPEELLKAIRRAAVGRTYVTEGLSDVALETGNNGEQLPHHRLTAREYQVFIQLIGGSAVRKVAVDLGLSGSTVSNHVASIKRKLSADSVAGIVRYAARVGLV